MNYYNSDKYLEKIEDYNEKYFSKCDFSVPKETIVLSNEYVINFYPIYRIISEEYNTEILECVVYRLYKGENIIFEWKSLYNVSRISELIKHSNGNSYLIFTEDLYGYSVLELETLKSVHYLPSESYFEGEDFKETFIWNDMHYNKYNNYLAVGGCFWATPSSVIVLDFSNPLEIVDSNNWLDFRKEIDPDYIIYGEVLFEKWDKSTLICKSEEDLYIEIDI